MKRNSIQTQEQCHVSALCVIPFFWGEGQQLIKGKRHDRNKPRGTRRLSFYMEPLRRCWVKA